MSKRFEPRPFESISPTDWAYLAGLIDGEGCIIIKGSRIKHSDNGHWYDSTCHVLQLHITNNDARMVTWVAETFGVGVVAVKHMERGKHSRHFLWRVHSAKAAWILEGCLPYFRVKREQAEEGIAFRALVGHSYGKKLTAENLAAREVAKQRLKAARKPYLLEDVEKVKQVG